MEMIMSEKPPGAAAGGGAAASAPNKCVKPEVQAKVVPTIQTGMQSIIKPGKVSPFPLEVVPAPDVTWKWDSPSVAERLPPQLQELLNNIKRTCRVGNYHHDIAEAQAGTIKLHGLFVQLATDMDTTPGLLEVLRDSASFFLSKLIKCVNRHFANRPHFHHSRRRDHDWDGSADLESADPLWGIKRCLLRFVELLTENERERQRNMSKFKELLDHPITEHQRYSVTMFRPESGRDLRFATLDDAFKSLEHYFQRTQEGPRTMWRFPREVAFAFKFIASDPGRQGRINSTFVSALLFGCIDNDASVAHAALTAMRRVPKDYLDYGIRCLEPFRYHLLLARIAQLLEFRGDHCDGWQRTPETPTPDQRRAAHEVLHFLMHSARDEDRSQANVNPEAWLKSAMTKAQGLGFRRF